MLAVVRRQIGDVRRKTRDAVPARAYSPAMDRTTNWAGEGMMVNANQQRHFSESLLAKSMMIAAGLLIVLGTVLQLGQLGYDHISPGNFWLVSMVAQGLWNLVAMHMNGPAMQEVLRFWPLMLVSVGLGILMLRMEQR
jgi:hypothetical protein